MIILLSLIKVNNAKLTPAWSAFILCRHTLMLKQNPVSHSGNRLHVSLVNSLTSCKAMSLLSLDGLLMCSVRKQSKLNVQSKAQ